MATLLISVKVHPASEVQRIVEEVKLGLEAVPLAEVEAIDDNVVITVAVDSPDTAEEVTRSIDEVLRTVDQDLQLKWGDLGQR